MLDFVKSGAAKPPRQFLMTAGTAQILMLACVLGAAHAGNAQSTPTTATSPQSADAAKPAAQQVQPVTTTVVVNGEVKDDYLPEALSVGTLDGATLKETPLSATVVT